MENRREAYVEFKIHKRFKEILNEMLKFKFVQDIEQLEKMKEEAIEEEEQAKNSLKELISSKSIKKNALEE